MGTDYWMPPEMLKSLGQKSTKIYGKSVDIWSLGIFAVELAQKVPPFYETKDQMTLYRKIVHSETPPLDTRWSSDYQDFVNLCLIKEEKLRPSAEKLLQHPFLIGAD